MSADDAVVDVPAVNDARQVGQSRTRGAVRQVSEFSERWLWRTVAHRRHSPRLLGSVEDDVAQLVGGEHHGVPAGAAGALRAGHDIVDVLDRHARL